MEPEFAWYVTCIPAITTMDAALDLYSQFGNPVLLGLHPNDPGVLKVVQWVCAYIAQNIGMMIHGPLPAARPAYFGGVYSSSTAGLGGRIGYT
jgi:hypothetical protein